MASRRPNTPARTPAAVPPTAPSADPIAAASEPDASAKVAARKPRAKKAAAPQALVSPTVQISEDTRRGMIAEAAYLRAERRGFSGGPEREREDWLAAEAEVDALLKAGHGSPTQ